MQNKVLKKLPIVIFITLLLFPLFTYLLLERQHFLILSVPFFCYFFYRAFVFSVSLYLGYRRYLNEEKINWFKKLNNQSGNLPDHLIVVPVYKEDFYTIDRLLDSIIRQKYDLKKIHISITIEQRDDFADLKEEILSKYGNYFNERIQIYSHILNTEKEVRGAASNRTFGAKNYVEFLGDNNLSNFLVTSPDSDTVFSNQYFARISYQWLEDKKPQNKFYQTGIYKFNNNYWQVPALVRTLSTGLSMSIISSSFYNGKERYTFSCFTLSLKTLTDLDYWDTKLSIDDTPFHFRALEYFNGDWKCSVFYAPISLDSIHSDNYLKTHIKQYEQYHRWGWGIIAFPLAVNAVFKSNINGLSKALKLTNIFNTFIFIKVIPVIITTYLLLIPLSSNPNFLIEALSIATKLNLILVIPVILTKLKLLKENSTISNVKLLLLVILEVPLGFVCLITYGFVPYIHAALEMALGFKPENRVRWSIKLIPDVNAQIFTNLLKTDNKVE